MAIAALGLAFSASSPAHAAGRNGVAYRLLLADTYLSWLFPVKNGASVTESGKPAVEAGGVEFLRMEKNAAVYAVDSGNFQFQFQP